jgi:uncharacterized delta-60 repeat protein
LADSFNPTGNDQVLAIALQTDGKILAGGSFTTIGGQTRNRFARFERNGNLDLTLNLNMVGNYVDALAVQADGKIIIGGNFSTILSITRNRIARLNPDGTLDGTFNPNANSDVSLISIQPDGKILVGGVFTNIGGQTRNRIARLDATTGAADSFNPNADSDVGTIVVQPDGKILVCGNFSSIGGQTRNSIARLDQNTGLADSFNPIQSSSVFAIALQTDGKILIGGNFTFVNGIFRRGIARLDANGTLDSFNPNANGFVTTIAAQSDGKILIGGNFTNVNSQPRLNFARLDATTGLPDSFNPGVDGYVHSIAVQSDGKILLGGNFNNVGIQPRNFFARLSNDTAALQNLSVAETTIVWTRNGSAPQFTRTTFELSTDGGATYTFLGNGTSNLTEQANLKADHDKDGEKTPLAPQTSGSTLTGLNLPTAQNILIRTRGYHRSGFQNGSETTEELVRNNYLFAPTAANVSIGGRITTADGRGIRNAVVVLTGGNLPAPRTVRTGTFGYYSFESVEVGATYIIEIRSKSYQFTPQLVTVNEELTELNFTAEEYP